MIRPPPCAGNARKTAYAKNVAAVLILFTGTLAAAVQDWPRAPVKIVVPFAAGATPDIVARLVVDRLHKTLDRTFIIEN